MQSQGPRLRPAQLEEIVDEDGEMVDLLAHRREISIDGGAIVDDAVLECFDDGAHPGQRSTQVV